MNQQNTSPAGIPERWRILAGTILANKYDSYRILAVAMPVLMKRRTGCRENGSGSP